VGDDGVVYAEHKQHTVSPWKNVAHRGYPVGVRENTVPSFYEALKDNSTMVECDVRMTSDGVAVLCHDATITGTVSGTSTTMTIANSTLEQLRTMILSSSTVYGEVKIPTLEEALAFMSYHGMSANLDLKDVTDACLAEVVRLVKRFNMGDRIIYFTGTAPATTLKKVLELDGSARVVFYYSGISSVDAVTTDPKRVVIALQPSELSDAVVATIRDKGYAMYCWGVTTSTYTTAFNYFPDYVEYTTGTDVTDILEAHFQNVTFW
jgi:glycerophosphoryl diester phosphodiesterase